MKQSNSHRVAAARSLAPRRSRPVRRRHVRPLVVGAASAIEDRHRSQCARHIPPASAVKLPPLPYADAAPVLGPERSLLEERAARLAATAVIEPRDPTAAMAVYRNTLDRYAKLRYGGGTPAQLKEVARILDAGIDVRVDRDEMDLVDALELMAELLDVLEPDPARRGMLLAQWREQKLALARPSQPRDPELVRREAARVADWQAQPASERDARDLEWEIKEMREPRR